MVETYDLVVVGSGEYIKPVLPYRNLANAVIQGGSA
jgi:hypothetical protein